MLFQNKAIIAVSCILLSFGLLLAGAICNRMLDAPPTIPAYSIGENGETTAQETENPKYSDGTKREIVQFFYDVNPGGQAIQCSTMQPVNLTRLPIYSLAIIVLTTGAGVWIFKKKRFKIKERTHYVMVMAFHKWIDLNNYLATHQNTFIAKICTRNRKFIFRKAHNR